MDHRLTPRRLGVVLLEVLTARHALLVVRMTELASMPNGLVEERLVVLLYSAPRDLARSNLVPVISAHSNLHRVEVTVEGSHTLAIRREATAETLLHRRQAPRQLLCLLGETLLTGHPLRQKRDLPALCHRLLVDEELTHHHAVDGRPMEADAWVNLLVSEREEVTPAPILWNQVQEVER